MKFIGRESTLHMRKRVARRCADAEEREYIWISLHTDSEQVAARNAPTIWDPMIEAWEARLAGGAGVDAEAQLAAAKNLAAARGYRYLQAAEVAKLPMNE